MKYSELRELIAKEKYSEIEHFLIHPDAYESNDLSFEEFVSYIRHHLPEETKKQFDNWAEQMTVYHLPLKTQRFVVQHGTDLESLHHNASFEFYKMSLDINYSPIHFAEVVGIDCQPHILHLYRIESFTLARGQLLALSTNRTRSGDCSVALLCQRRIPFRFYNDLPDGLEFKPYKMIDTVVSFIDAVKASYPNISIYSDHPLLGTIE